MRYQNIFSASLAASLLAVAAGSAVAQPAEQPGANERAQSEAARQQAQREHEAEKSAAENERRQQAAEERADVQQQLAEARREMEEAARQVARLSGQLAAPFVDGVARGFRFAGQRAMLGIGIEDTERGVRVASVSPNGPAADAGLKVGETMVAIDGAALADTRVAGGGKQSPSELLLAQMANVDGGEEVKLRVLNEKGAERDVTVKVREISPWVHLYSDDNTVSLPPMPALPALPALKGPNYTYAYRYGPDGWFFNSANPWSQMQVIVLTPALGKYFGTDKGLLVVRGPDGAELGLRDGDVILDIGGREPTTPEHAMRILGSFAGGEAMKVTIMREQRRQTIEVKIPVPADR